MPPRRVRRRPRGASLVTTVAGGMIASTVLNLAFIPVLYVVIRSFGRKKTVEEAEPHA